MAIWIRALVVGLAVMLLGTGHASAVGPAQPVELQPRELTRMGDAVYFFGCSGDGGCELWRTDGTGRGTRLVKDFGPGLRRVSPHMLVAADHRLFFLASDWAHGEELWTSDGTPRGTHMVKAILPGKASTFPYSGEEGKLLLPVGDRVFFGVDDGRHGWEPWVSDGTAAGTYLIKEADPKDRFSPTLWTRVGRRAFFVTGSQLWVTDGTARGTRLVKVFAHWTFGRGDQLAAMDGRLYIGGARWLWVSDGTPEGTTVVKELSSRSGASLAHLTAIRHRLWFAATTPDTGVEPWVSDGTPHGTHPVVDVALGEDSGEPTEFTRFGDRVLFTDGSSIWRSDGTRAGTERIHTPAIEGTATPSDLVRYQGSVLFVARRYWTFRPDHLWRTDGTDRGTERITRVWPAFGGYRYAFTRVNGLLVYVGGLPSAGHELWRTDGTAGGTRMVKDLQ